MTCVSVSIQFTLFRTFNTQKTQITAKYTDSHIEMNCHGMGLSRVYYNSIESRDVKTHRNLERQKYEHMDHHIIGVDKTR